MCGVAAYRDRANRVECVSWNERIMGGYEVHCVVPRRAEFAVHITRLCGHILQRFLAAQQKLNGGSTDYESR